MIEVHINPYDVQKQEINVGHLKDHNAYKIIFDELEGSNYQLKVKINNYFEQFPITNNEWIITSSYTQKSPITIQVVEVVEDSLIYHGEEITTVEQFKEWLSQNNISIRYVLENPTETPIDPEQLTMLRSLYTYNGVTNFLCNAPVSFTYERSLQIVINNLENAINQTNANILLGGNQ